MRYCASRTIAAAFGSETMAVTPHDVTSPLPTVIDTANRSIARRPVPTAMFWLIIVLLASGLAAAVVTLRKKVERQKPTAVITPAQIARKEVKERELAAARAHVRAGRYAEAITAYDLLLARHPESLTARHEREEAAREFEASMPKSEVTKVAKKTPSKKDDVAEAKPPEPEKKLSRWERFKRWLREDAEEAELRL